MFQDNLNIFWIFRGDRVEIMVGKDKGKQGIVSQVIQERNWVIVEGLNTHLRVVSTWYTNVIWQIYLRVYVN